MWLVWLALTFIICLALGYFLPRLSIFVFGPAVFVFAAYFFYAQEQYLSFFHSDGSAAGLVVPFLMWAVLGIICAIGATLVGMGFLRLTVFAEDPDVDRASEQSDA